MSTTKDIVRYGLIAAGVLVMLVLVAIVIMTIYGESTVAIEVLKTVVLVVSHVAALGIGVFAGRRSRKGKPSGTVGDDAVDYEEVEV